MIKAIMKINQKKLKKKETSKTEKKVTNSILKTTSMKPWN